jgi:hypothetical protein
MEHKCHCKIQSVSQLRVKPFVMLVVLIQLVDDKSMLDFCVMVGFYERHKLGERGHCLVQW